jgi:chromosome segregation ATPase
MKTFRLMQALLAISIFLSACSNKKAEYEKLMEENAQLQQKMNNLSEEERLLKGEYANAVETLNAIEDSLQAIADREKDIQKLTRKIDETKDLDQKQVILAKLQVLQSANDKSKDEARQLQSKLGAYRVENEQLRKMIAQAETRLLAKEQELSEVQKGIDDLRYVLSRLEAQLLESKGELSGAYETLKKKNGELSSTNEKLTSTLSDLKKKTVFIEEQARGYVSCGTKKVLRQKGILSKTNLKLTKEYQTAVKANSYAVNYFESDLIECGTGGKIEVVLPERDPASYKVDGYKLTILNTELFWKTDKIVVIVKE